MIELWCEHSISYIWNILLELQSILGSYFKGF